MHYFLLAAELLPKFDGAWLDERMAFIEANGWVDDPKLIALLEACGASFDAIRMGLDVGNAKLPPLRGFAEPMTYVSQWRTLARLMALEGTMYAAHGDYAAAFGDYATLLEFGNESRRGGAIIGGLAGTAMSDTAAQALHGELPRSQASPEEYRDLLSRLEALQTRHHTMSQSVQSEVEAFEDWFGNTYGTEEQMRDLLTNPDMGLQRDFQRWATTAVSEELESLMADMLQSYRNIVPYFELPYYEAREVDFGTIVGDNPVMQLIVEPLARLPEVEAREQARTNAVVTQAALELYRSEQGQYPASLEAFVPDILTQVPQDPFTGGPMAYAVSADGYLLYSAGNDMEDNGGRINEYSEPGGDLVFHAP